MAKTLIGPRLRKLRSAHKQTQADMAKALGVSPAYINLLENNQRSLSVQMLMAISEAYDIDLKDLTKDDSSRKLGDLRNALNDPIFAEDRPELQELRGAIDHAPRFVDQFLRLHQAHRSAMEMLKRSEGDAQVDDMMRSSPESAIHDFFRGHSNHFPTLELAAEEARKDITVAPETLFVDLRDGLKATLGLEVKVEPIGALGDSLRVWNRQDGVVQLSQALSSENRAFQLAHILAFSRCSDVIDDLAASSKGVSEQAMPRLKVELANYFASAFMMPYQPFLDAAEDCLYDIDRLAAGFGVTFEQAGQRLTTLQREGARGVPFFFLRVDRAGNVTKRFNSTSFDLAEYGGACPVWNVHTAFYTPGVVMPQFVEMPDGQRFFTLSRTVHRPVFSEETQDRRLTLALGCEAVHAPRIRYARNFRSEDDGIFHQIGINCHLCPRQNCSQRAHQPLIIDLPINANRRGSTRYES